MKRAEHDAPQRHASSEGVPMDSVDRETQRLLGLIVKAAQLNAANTPSGTIFCARSAPCYGGWSLNALPARSPACLPALQWLNSSFTQGYRGALQFADEPTMLCHAIAMENNPRQGWELVQQTVKNVRDLSRTRPHADDEYRMFRMLLIDHGVVDADRSLDFLIPLQVSFNSLYEPIPEHFIRAGQVYLCPSCGWPMEISRRAVSCGAYWCEQTVGIAQWACTLSRPWHQCS